MTRVTGPDTAILDVDGTLVDSNYHHALAWFRAFRAYDITCELWRIHRSIGMGGDRLVAALAGEEIEDRHGDDLRAAWTGEFDRLIGEVRPFAGTRPLLEAVRERGFTLVLASSGAREHVETFLDLFHGRDLADVWTTSEDAESSKPAPDLIQVALRRAGEHGGGRGGVLVGDTTWDCEAGRRANVPTLAVRTGGFSTEELQAAGAIEVYDSLDHLRTNLDDTPLRLVD